MTPEGTATGLDAVCSQPGGPLRPTFCNVPHWAELFLYAGSALAIAIFAYGLWRHVRLWRDGRPAPRRNVGQAGARWRIFLTDVIAQRRTVRRRLPAVFHSGLFYGFGLLFIGTVLATVDYDVFWLL